MVVLVTGATGFLGGALVRSLRADRVDVIATGRDKARLTALGLRERAAIAVDLADSAAVDRAFEQRREVTEIVHCAALSSPWGPRLAFERANVLATENMLACARKLGVRRFVQISSPSIYFRFADQLGLRETTPLPPPVNAYAATKAIAEDRVRAADVPATILRPRGLYGAGDTALLPRLMCAAANGPLPLFRDGQAQTDITHVSDVVAAIRAALELADTPEAPVFNISGGVPLHIREIVTKACARQSVAVRWKALPLGPSLAAVRFGERLARLRPGQPEPRVTAYGLGLFAFSQTLDLSAARERLGWVPRVSFEEGLAETFSGGAAL